MYVWFVVVLSTNIALAFALPQYGAKTRHSDDWELTSLFDDDQQKPNSHKVKSSKQYRNQARPLQELETGTNENHSFDKPSFSRSLKRTETINKSAVNPFATYNPFPRDRKFPKLPTSHNDQQKPSSDLIKKTPSSAYDGQRSVVADTPVRRSKSYNPKLNPKVANQYGAKKGIVPPTAFDDRKISAGGNFADENQFWPAESKRDNIHLALPRPRNDYL